MDDLKKYIEKRNKLTKIITTMAIIISLFFMMLSTSFIVTVLSKDKLENLRNRTGVMNIYSEHSIIQMVVISFITLTLCMAFFIMSIQLKSASNNYEVENIIRKNKNNSSEKRDFYGLDSIKYRIQKHISSVKGYALSNLIIGTSISIFGIFFVFNLLNGTFSNYAIDYSKINEVSYKAFFIIFIIPKLSIAFMIQIFSYFFLSMYRANLREVRYFQMELNDIDLIQEAILIFDTENEKISEAERYIVNKIFDIVDLRGREIRKNISSDEMIETLNSLSGNADIISKLKYVFRDKK